MNNVPTTRKTGDVLKATVQCMRTLSIGTCGINKISKGYRHGVGLCRQN